MDEFIQTDRNWEKILHELSALDGSGYKDLKDANVKVHIYDGNNMELGALCGKPFSVSALAIIDKGSSNILTL